MSKHSNVITSQQLKDLQATLSSDAVAAIAENKCQFFTVNPLPGTLCEEVNESGERTRYFILGTLKDINNAIKLIGRYIELFGTKTNESLPLLQYESETNATFVQESQESNEPLSEAEPSTSKTVESESSTSIADELLKRMRDRLSGPRKPGVMETCPYCSFTSDKYCHMSKHISLHSLNRPLYQCSRCEYKVMNRVRVLRHEMEVHDVQRLKSKCPYCKYVSASGLHLRKHLKIRHPQCPEVNLPVSYCDECDYSSNSPLFMIRHKRKHSKEHELRAKPMRCERCSYVSDNRSRFFRHVRSCHPSDESVLCSDCGSTFVNIDMLRSHQLRQHPTLENEPEDGQAETLEEEKEVAPEAAQSGTGTETLRTLSCTDCFMSFDTSRDLYRHRVRFHHAERRYSCNICQKRFGHAGHLMMHKSRCRLTNIKKVYQFDDLNAVAKKDEGVQNLEDAEIDPWADQSVTIESNSATTLAPSGDSDVNLYLAAAGVDDTIELVTCSFCGATFGRSNCLKKHINTCHQDMSRPYSCSICTCRFASRASLLRHISVRHPAFVTQADALVIRDTTHRVSGQKNCDFRCQFCGHFFATQAFLVKHEDLFHRDASRIFQCAECTCRFVTQDRLERHHRRYHKLLASFERWSAPPQSMTSSTSPDAVTTEEGFSDDDCDQKGRAVCKICGFLVKRGSRTFVSHMCHHLTRSGLRCSRCCARFSQPAVRMRHARIHPKNNINNCPHCVAPFKTSNLLKHHMSLYHTEASAKQQQSNNNRKGTATDDVGCEYYLEVNVDDGDCDDVDYQPPWNHQQQQASIVANKRRETTQLTQQQQHSGDTNNYHQQQQQQTLQDVVKAAEAALLEEGILIEEKPKEMVILVRKEDIPPSHPPPVATTSKKRVGRPRKRPITIVTNLADDHQVAQRIETQNSQSGVAIVLLSPNADEVPEVDARKPASTPEAQTGSNRCTRCGFDFATDKALEKHVQLLHEDLTRNYMCGICTCRFAATRGLDMHIKRWHNNRADGPVGFKKQRFANRLFYEHGTEEMSDVLKCFHCRKQCVSTIALEAHEEAHSASLPTPFSCTLCAVTLQERSAILNHTATCTGENHDADVESAVSD